MDVISHGSSVGGRLPRGPHQLRPEDVAADQRKRLVEAMVQFAGTQGFAVTTVADLIEHAAVSRKTFYELFRNREELLAAAFEDSAIATLLELDTALERSGGRTRQLEALMRRLCHSARERPGMIALCTVEIAAAGSSGLDLRAKLMGSYGHLIQECLRPMSEQPIPETLAITLAGSAYREIDAHLRAGHVDDLPDLALQLARWIRSYHPVPAELETDREPAKPWRWMGPEELIGGRAPGTLTLAPMGDLHRLGKPSSGLLAHAHRERILDAVAQINTERGYTALTAEAIAAQADLPDRVFRAQFKSKDEAFTAAVELGHIKGQAIVERARAGHPEWRDGVANAITALLEFFASEPRFTRLALIDAPLATPMMARRSNEHAAAYARLVFDGAPQRRRPPLIAPEAIIFALFELSCRYLVQQRVAQLPRAGAHATYVALAPFLGATEAARVAMG